MTDVEPVVTDFEASGRAGRRNALPDILGSPAGVGAGAGTSDLPHKLAELSVSQGYHGFVVFKGSLYPGPPRKSELSKSERKSSPCKGKVESVKHFNTKKNEEAESGEIAETMLENPEMEGKSSAS